MRLRAVPGRQTGGDRAELPVKSGWPVIVGQPCGDEHVTPVVSAHREHVTESRDVSLGKQDDRRVHALGAEGVVTGRVLKVREEAQDLLGRTRFGKVQSYAPLQSCFVCRHELILSGAPPIARSSRVT